MKILLLILFSFILNIRQVQGQIPRETFLKEQVQKQLNELLEGSTAYTGLAAIDLTSRETFLYQEDQVFAQASAIKIPILMEVYKQASEGKIALTNLVYIKSKDRVGGSGILQSLEGDMNLSIRNLCILMITRSDNTATNVLIGLVGMDRINKSMEEIGLKNTRLRRLMMDEAASARGEENTSTPLEAITLLQRLYEGTFVSKQVSADILSTLALSNRSESRIGASVPTEQMVAYKSGSLKGVSTEWALVWLKGRPYAVAMMEALKIDGRSANLMEQISKVFYDFYNRLEHSTAYGSYQETKQNNIEK